MTVYLPLLERLAGMIINAISQLGAQLLDTNRARASARASWTRKPMSIRATHRAAYNFALGEETEIEETSPSPSIPVEVAFVTPADVVVAEDEAEIYRAMLPVSRQVTTLADAEEAYASN